MADALGQNAKRKASDDLASPRIREASLPTTDDSRSAVPEDLSQPHQKDTLQRKFGRYEHYLRKESDEKATELDRANLHRARRELEREKQEMEKQRELRSSERERRIRERQRVLQSDSERRRFEEEMSRFLDRERLMKGADEDRYRTTADRNLQEFLEAERRRQEDERSHLKYERDRFEDERRHFEKEKDWFSEERRRFEKEMSHLNDDRKRLEHDRTRFEEERKLFRQETRKLAEERKVHSEKRKTPATNPKGIVGRAVSGGASKKIASPQSEVSLDDTRSSRFGAYHRAGRFVQPASFYSSKEKGRKEGRASLTKSSASRLSKRKPETNNSAPVMQPPSRSRRVLSDAGSNFVDIKKVTSYLAQNLVFKSGVKFWSNYAHEEVLKNKLWDRNDKKRYLQDRLEPLIREFLHEQRKHCHTSTHQVLLDIREDKVAKKFLKYGLPGKGSGGETAPDFGQFAASSPIRDALDLSNEDLEFLVPSSDSTAFQKLLNSIRNDFYRDQSSILAGIDNSILKMASPKAPISSYSGRQAETFTVQLTLDWDPVKFLNSQFQNRKARLGSIVTITGSAFYAYATTCSKYVEYAWPETGSFILSCLEQALGWEGRKDSLTKDANRMKNLEISVGSFPADSKGKITVKGSIVRLCEVAQVLAWLSAALDVGPNLAGQLSYSKVKTQCTSTLPHQLHIHRELEPLHRTETPCWLPLFENAAIALGFPVPDRHEEIGIEMPIELMAAIAGIHHAVEFEGGIVMKGFSSMFIPVRRTANGVQWHFIRNEDSDTRLTYQDAISRCEERALIDEVDFDTIKNSRAFIGWCSVAEVRLGSRTINYHNIDYSRAAEEVADLRVSGGSLGFQQWGLAQFDFEFGPKDGKLHLQQNGPYRNIIASAEKTPVVLFDTAARRGWLVSAADVMLHIAQHRHTLDPFVVKDSEVEFVEGKSTRATLLKNASLALSDEPNDTFRGMVTRTWSQMEALFDYRLSRDRTPGKQIRNPLSHTLYGYEYNAIVEEKVIIRPKEWTLQGTHGGWHALAKDIDALVLFGSGFDNLIRPVLVDDICQHWREVPSLKDYLATSANTLQHLFDVAGSKYSQEYITTTHLQWHRGTSKLFEPCLSTDLFSCACDRLQQILPKSNKGKIVPPGPLEEQGAVIFGKRGSSFFRRAFSTPLEKGGRLLRGKRRSSSMTIVEEDLLRDKVDSAYACGNCESCLSGGMSYHANGSLPITRCLKSTVDLAVRMAPDAAHDAGEKHLSIGSSSKARQI